MHTEQTINRHMSEPPDGTRIVILVCPDEHKVVWRDDAEAGRWGANPEERWFDSGDSDPMGFHEHLKHADAVWVLPDQPTIVLQD